MSTEAGPPSVAPSKVLSQIPSPMSERHNNGHHELLEPAVAMVVEEHPAIGPASKLGTATATIASYPLQLPDNTALISHPSPASIATIPSTSSDLNPVGALDGMPIDPAPSTDLASGTVPGPSKSLLSSATPIEDESQKVQASYKRKSEALVLPGKRSSSKKHKSSDVNSSDILAEFEKSAFLPKRISSPAGLTIVESPTVSAISLPFPAEVSMSAPHTTTTSSATASQSSFLRLRSSEASVAGDENVTVSAKVSHPTAEHAQLTRQDEEAQVHLPATSTPKSMAGGAGMAEIVRRVERDGMDELASSDMDLSDDDGDIPLKTLLPDPASRVGGVVQLSPVSSTTIVETGPASNPRVTKTHPASLTPQRSLQLDELLVQKVLQAERTVVNGLSVAAHSDQRGKTSC